MTTTETRIGPERMVIFCHAAPRALLFSTLAAGRVRLIHSPPHNPGFTSGFRPAPPPSSCLQSMDYGLAADGQGNGGHDSSSSRGSCMGPALCRCVVSVASAS